MGRRAEDRLLEAMQGRVRPLHEDADVVAEVGASMQRISRRIRRKLVEGSTTMWTGPGADEARAAFLALAAETETRGRTFEEAAKPMREAARAITRSREAYDTLPDPSGVRANPGLVGDGGFQDRESMDAWVQAQRAALAEEREKESARHYRQYSASMTAAADDLARTLPDRGPAPQPVDTSVTPWSPGAYTPPPADDGRPGVVGGAPDGSSDGSTGGVLGGSGSGGTTEVGWGGTGDDVPDLSLGDHDDSGTGTGSDDDPARRGDGEGGRSGLATGLGIGAGVAAVGAVGLGVGMARGRGDRQTPGGLLASAAGARGDGRGAGGRTDGGRRAATGPAASGGTGGAARARSGIVPVTGMAGPPPRDGGRGGAGGRGGSGARGVPVTGAVGRDERGEASAGDHWAVEDDWFGEDEAGPSVLR